MWWRDEGAAVWLGWSDILRWMNGCGGGCGLFLSLKLSGLVCLLMSRGGGERGGGGRRGREHGMFYTSVSEHRE